MSNMQTDGIKTLFPMFLKLEGRQVLVVGAGRVGEPKIRGLLTTGAEILVVAREASPAVVEWARNGQVVLEERSFTPPDLDRALFVVAATSSRELNEFIFLESHARRVLCNVVDVPEQCDFYYPAVVRRGHLQIAISTGGQSPVLARKIRQQLEQQYGPGYADWVTELGETRRKILASDLNPEQKLDLLESLANVAALEIALAAQSSAKEGTVAA